MSKLTPEQKALNKEATKLRDRAFTQRKSAYRSELDAATAAIASGPVGLAVAAADKAFDEALNARNAAVASIDEQIAALQEKREATRQQHEQRIQVLKAARQASWDEKNQAEAQVQATLKEKYPDVADCWSAAAWKPFKQFLPQVASSTK